MWLDRPDVVSVLIDAHHKIQASPVAQGPFASGIDLVVRSYWKGNRESKNYVYFQISLCVLWWGNEFGLQIELTAL